MARKLRDVERVEFTVDDLGQVVAHMARLASAEDGWINAIPKINDNDEKPTSLGFFTLFNGSGSGVTMCTWVPGSHSRRGLVRPNLGIAHGTGRRIFAELHSLAVPIPENWFVEQDHPRRGLVLRVPSDEAHAQVLMWALRAVIALKAPRPIREWRADVYLPAACET
ncbi:MAG: hypothetical protein ACLPUG_18560 [Acidimicrobiales bacterium]